MKKINVWHDNRIRNVQSFKYPTYSNKVMKNTDLEPEFTER